MVSEARVTTTSPPMMIEMIYDRRRHNSTNRPRASKAPDVGPHGLAAAGPNGTRPMGYWTIVCAVTIIPRQT